MPEVKRTTAERGPEVSIMPLPIQVACPVPVTPAGETMRDGEPIDMVERTELCAVMAHWMVGGQICCDEHFELFCEVGGIDFEDCVREIGRSVAEARRPRAERKRGTQEEARDVKAKMEGGE